MGWRVVCAVTVEGWIKVEKFDPVVFALLSGWGLIIWYVAVRLGSAAYFRSKQEHMRSVHKQFSEGGV